MSVRIRPFLAVLIAIVSLQATASAGLIFDNSVTGNQGITTGAAAQFATEVTAAPGTPRTVTELDLGFTSQGSAATATVQAFLYANDGANGSPGTLLWKSALTNISINSTNILIAFAVPSIVVSDTFSFAGAITNPSPLVGFVPASGASTGTFVQAYSGSPGAWQSLPSAFEIEGRVIAATAVPEPSTLVLLGMGLAGVVVFGRSRRFAAAGR